MRSELPRRGGFACLLLRALCWLGVHDEHEVCRHHTRQFYPAIERIAFECRRCNRRRSDVYDEFGLIRFG